MNCAAVQNQILMQPDPRELPPALREHVGACAGCREWARKAARLEAALESLPAPAAPEQKKEEMLGDLMQADPVIRPLPTFAARPGFGTLAARFLRRNAAYVGGLAAAVLVAVGAFWLFSGPRGPQQQEMVKTEKYPLLDKMVRRDAELARANSAARKLEVLGGMAEDISTETRGMARIAPGSELRQMAGWYEKTVKEGLVKQANNLPVGMSAAEKAKLLESLAAKLDADAAAAEALSHESPPDAQQALKRVAEAAREGKDSLRAAARGGK
jgi:hypothetical protein